MRAVARDAAAQLQELGGRVFVRRHRRAKRDLSEILQQIVDADRPRVVVGPEPIARGERLDAERGQAEQVVAAVEHHVDREIVAGVDAELRTPAVAQGDARPFGTPIERRVLQADERLDVEQRLDELVRVDAAERREHRPQLEREQRPAGLGDARVHVEDLRARSPCASAEH